MSKKTYSLGQLAKLLNAELVGDPSCEIHHVAALASAKAGDISFLADRKLAKELAETEASAVILPQHALKDCHVNALLLEQPKRAFMQLLELFHPKAKPKPGIHPSAVVGEHCHIDPTATIGPQVVIEDHVEIGPRTVIAAGSFIGLGVEVGEDCQIYANVTLYHGVRLGARVILHSGVVIGADGFGLEPTETGAWIKVPQVGAVVLGDDVEIGANSCVDRGALDNTVIEDGVKIDDLVMIGHNVRIGKHTAIAGCAGVAGSTTIGQNCMIGGGACINGHIKITDRVAVTGYAGIHKSIDEPGVYSSGTIQQTREAWRKSVVRFWHLDDMAKRLQRLEKLYGEQDGH